jgi:hypothetical protein
MKPLIEFRQSSQFNSERSCNMERKAIRTVLVLLLFALLVALGQRATASASMSLGPRAALVTAGREMSSSANADQIRSWMSLAASNATSSQIYYTSRIRVRSGWYFTRLIVCGHNTQWQRACRNEPDQGYAKDITWWLRPDLGIDVAVYLPNYNGWKYCQGGVKLLPPYNGGWVTITYKGNGVCTIQNGLH